MIEERRKSSSSRHRVCDLSIRGEAIATPVRPQSTLQSGYNRTTGEVDIETVHRACTPKGAGAARPRTGALKAASGRRTCPGPSPECRTVRSPWDFDPFLKDDTGRMISTKTPVAKITAPISPVKVPRIERAASRQQHASKSDENDSSGKFKQDKEVTDSKQHANRLDENNSSNKSKAYEAEMRTRASMDGAPRVNVNYKSKKNSSSGPFKDYKQGADNKQRANRSDENNSSNKSRASEAEMRTSASMVRAPRVNVVNVTYKSNKNSSSGQFKDGKQGADNQQRSSRLDDNNSSNKAEMTTRRSLVKASGVEVAAASKQRVNKMDKNNSSSQSKDDTAKAEVELNLPAVDLERALSLSTFQPEEKRRRSPSLQVLCLT